MLRDRRAVQLTECWNERRCGSGFPARQAFDPADLGFALGNLMLVDVVRAPLRFRLKLVGSNIARHLGFDATGLYLDDYPAPEFGHILRSIHADALARREPVAIRCDQAVVGQALRCECLLLPLSDDGETITSFMTGVFFQDVRRPVELRSFSAFAEAPESLRPGA